MEKKSSRKNSLRPPYNLNIAYQGEPNSSTSTDNYTRASVSTLVDQNEYSVLQTRPKITPKSNTEVHENNRIFCDISKNIAKEYEIYITEDWKDLQDSMLSKIHTNTLESNDDKLPKPSVWTVCFRKYKKRWEKSQNEIKEEEINVKTNTEFKQSILEKSVNPHSYTNPVMAEYSNSSDTYGIIQTPTTPNLPATYALVVKKNKRKTDALPLTRLGDTDINSDNFRHKESDLGLV
ncbi:uncharacterized protein CEXT_663521 [Caerostris extrusa]|uniref:Uncharacterized protein n=1 Tax=Caerostris extrusa TaxID=172846 RepID=A0AAV4PYT8_CAEEX|nr:uncharacterized protein CEXT_663521 [Caerostris extrusa]